MFTEIKAPVFPESVAEGTVATWHKQPGQACARDELIVDIETDKVVLEIVAPADGVIEEILKNDGDTVESGEVIGRFKAGAAGESEGSDSKDPVESKDQGESKDESADAMSSSDVILSPAARKLADENNVEPGALKGTGKDGRISKEDVQSHIDNVKSSIESPAANASRCAGSRDQRRRAY